jgi:hypothetical protein
METLDVSIFYEKNIGMVGNYSVLVPAVGNGQHLVLHQ